MCTPGGCPQRETARRVWQVSGPKRREPGQGTGSRGESGCRKRAQNACQLTAEQRHRLQQFLLHEGRLMPSVRVAGEWGLEIGRFCDGLRRDEKAVNAAVIRPWSNGQVEGQIQVFAERSQQLVSESMAPVLSFQDDRRAQRARNSM